MKQTNRVLEIIGTIFMGAVVGGTIGILYSKCKNSNKYTKLLSNFNEHQQDVEVEVYKQIDGLRSRASLMENVIRDKQKMEEITNEIKQKMARENV